MNKFIICSFLSLLVGCGDWIEQSADKFVGTTFDAIEEVAEDEACKAERALFSTLQETLDINVSGEVIVSKAQIDAFKVWLNQNPNSSYHNFFDQFYKLDMAISSIPVSEQDSFDGLLTTGHLKNLFFKVIESELLVSNVRAFAKIDASDKTLYYGLSIKVTDKSDSKSSDVYFCE